MTFSFIRTSTFNIKKWVNKTEKGFFEFQKSYLNIRKLISNNKINKSFYFSILDIRFLSLENQFLILKFHFQILRIFFNIKN